MDYKQRDLKVVKLPSLNSVKTIVIPNENSLFPLPLQYSIIQRRNNDSVDNILIRNKNKIKQLLNNCNEERKKKYSYYIQKLYKIKHKKNIRLKKSQYKAQKKYFERRCYTYFIGGTVPISHIKPAIRQGATLTLFKHQLYLYGGIGYKLHNNWFKFNKKKVWEQISAQNNQSQNGLSGHTACIYKNQIVLFGGQTTYNFQFKFRECNSQIRLFNPQKNKMTVIRSNLQYATRKHHGACIIGKNMIVIGGLDMYGKFIEQIYQFNMQNYTWSTIYTKKPTKLAYFSCNAIFKGNINSLKFDQVTNIYKKTHYWIKEEGIYCFGGKSQNQKISNKMRVLMPSLQLHQFKVLHTNGITPQHRYSCSQSYLEEQGYIVIYGGRNNLKQKSLTRIFNDIFLFDLSNFNWVKIDLKEEEFPERYSHSSAVIGSKIYIFGGIRQKELMNGQLMFIETNPLIEQSKEILE